MSEQPTMGDQNPPRNPAKDLFAVGAAARRRGQPLAVVRATLAAANSAMPEPIDDLAVERIIKRLSAIEPADTDPDAPEWQRQLKRDGNGVVARTAGNAALYLQYHPKFQGTLGYDTFADRLVWTADAPGIGERDLLARPASGDKLADWHHIYVGHALSLFSGVVFPPGIVREALEQAARNRAVHPVCSWLRALAWDGQPRLRTWLADYLGAVAEFGGPEYLTSVGTWWMMSAVARVMIPGCQADHMLVLEGPQGAGKSSAIELLTGEAWFLRSLGRIDSKDALQALRGRWIVAMNELEAMRRVDLAAVKDFLTRTADEYRTSYGRLVLDYPRQCVFIGTTNDTGWNRDTTGARRFWPVSVGSVDRAAIERDRSQLWAEARTLFDDGNAHCHPRRCPLHRWWPGDDAIAALAAEQDARYDSDDWEIRIHKWLQDKPPSFTFDGDDMREALAIEVGRWGRAEQIRAGVAAHRCGCLKRRRPSGNRAWFYQLPRDHDHDHAEATPHADW